MTPIETKRSVALLILSDVIARALAKTAGEHTSALINGTDVQAESDNMSVLAVQKQLRLKGKV